MALTLSFEINIKPSRRQKGNIPLLKAGNAAVTRQRNSPLTNKVMTRILCISNFVFNLNEALRIRFITLIRVVKRK